MHPLTSKYKLYLYLFFLIFLTSIFNFKILDNYQDKFKLKEININGLSDEERRIVEMELINFKNDNIFKLSKKNVNEKLKKLNFLEDIYVKKIVPSTLNINLTKTKLVGKTIIDGEEFYIGENGKFVNSNQIFKTNRIPMIFGEFDINEFLNLHKILKNHHLGVFNIQKYYFYKNKRWDLIFSNGLTLMLPSQNIEESIKIYKKFLNNNSLMNIKIIDLRVKNQIILSNNE